MYNLGDHFIIDYNNAKSKEKAIFQGKKYRITILTERLIRLEYSTSGIFEDRPTQLALFRNFDVPNIALREDNKFLELTTKYFKLEYAKEKHFNSGAILAGTNLKVTLQNSENKIWYYGHPEVRNYFGTLTSLDDVDKNVKLKRGLYSLDGFSTIDDSESYVFDEQGMIAPRENKEIDIYLFMYRKDFGLCLRDYFMLSGKPPMIPRYALGNWWSKNSKYSDADIKELVAQFQKYEIPISTIILDKDWHIRNIDDKKDLQTGFSWNKQLFPTPYETISFLHNNKIRVGLNINPIDGIYPHEDMYQKAASYLENQEKKIIPFAPLNPKFLDVYLKLFIHSEEMLGVDLFWIDYNDTKKSLLPLWILNHYHFWDLERNESKRGIILSRNAMIAPHRYPILYSGETIVSWDMLKLLPYINSTSSNIGVSWWSHDIGGNHGGIEDNELYVRYVQLGVFSPIFRFHSARGKYYKREPWLWDVKTLEIVKTYMKLRHQLIPYLYTEAYEYHNIGTPLIQPLYYKYPEIYDNLVYRNEYYLGSELLVAPITDKKDLVMNRVVHHFFLPDGIWYDFKTGKKFPGKKEYISFYKDEDYPVFAKGGSIIPLAYNDMNDISAPQNMEINIFPGRSNTYKLYEDDGISRLYKDGYYILTSIDYNYRESNYTLIIRAVEGKSGIIPNTRNYKIKFRNTKKADEVIINFNDKQIDAHSYVDGPDFIIEVKDVPTIGQLTINCKGKDIEINTLRYINEEIDSIISDLQIETFLKESIADILFKEGYNIKKKRIEIRKLGRKGLKPLFVKLFLKLLEYIEQI
jgi:alpha-glucosidase (family GH31 glycosyl hydrolase)